MTKIAIGGRSELFDLANPSGPVDLKEIAKRLGNINRFSGGTVRPYSVAEHSIRVAALVPADQKLAALLHDVAEAFTGDIIQPIKRLMAPSFSNIEYRLNKWIGDELGVNIAVMSAEVHLADQIMQATETRDMVGYLETVPGMPASLMAVIESRTTFDTSDVADMWLRYVTEELAKRGTARCKK